MFKKLTVILILMALAVPALGQEMGNIQYGETVGGTLNGGGGHRWTFYGQAGDVVTISMVSESFDTYLELHDASLMMLTSDDDSGSYYNSRISNYRLPSTGQYGIVARSYGTDAVGSYGLTLDLVSGSRSSGPSNPPPPSATRLLGYGDAVQGMLYSEACQDWTFYGTAGDRVQIDMRSNDFDTYLYLIDILGGIVMEDDDGGSGTNSAITYTLNRSEGYTINACTYGLADFTGSYTLSLTFAGAVDQPSQTETRSNYLMANTYDIWTFDAMTGETITVNMQSLDFDTYLELYAPDGMLLASDDDGGGDLNSRIDGYILPSTGTYSIHLRSFDDYGSGDYTATLTFWDGFIGEIMPPMDGDYIISYGQRTSGRLTGSGGHRWAFYGSAGDTVRINVMSSDFDTYVELHDPSLRLLGEDDDGGSGTNSALTYTLPRSGEYGIVVHGYASGAVGTYTLELTAR